MFGGQIGRAAGLGLLLAAAPSPEQLAGTDMRPTGVAIETAMPMVDLQTCMIRLLQRYGRVTPLDLADGKALDWQPPTGLLAGPGKNVMTFELRDRGTTRVMTALYRHPYSAKNATKLLQDAAKHCFPTP